MTIRWDESLVAETPFALKVRSSPVDNDHEWQLSNGSRVLAFPTTAGDSYTASLAIVDEADLVPDLGRLMAADVEKMAKVVKFCGAKVE